VKGFLPAVLLLAACQGPGGPTLTTRWIIEKDTTAFRAPVTASWCGASQRLEFLAMRGDSGIGVALYPSDSAHLAGSYMVTEPGGPIQIRPGAGLAIRWFGKSVVEGYWGKRGTVTVTRTKRGRLGLAIDAELVSTVESGPALALTGSAGGIAVATDTACSVTDTVPIPAPAMPESDSREVD
jgi:hypothetical protein